MRRITQKQASSCP